MLGGGHRGRRLEAIATNGALWKSCSQVLLVLEVDGWLMWMAFDGLLMVFRLGGGSDDIRAEA